MKMGKTEWQAEMKLHEEQFEKLKERMPAELEARRAQLQKEVDAL